MVGAKLKTIETRDQVIDSLRELLNVAEFEVEKLMGNNIINKKPDGIDQTVRNKKEHSVRRNKQHIE